MSTIVRVSSIEGVCCCIVNTFRTESSVHYIARVSFLRVSVKREFTVLESLTIDSIFQSNRAVVAFSDNSHSALPVRISEGPVSCPE